MMEHSFESFLQLLLRPKVSGKDDRACARSFLDLLERRLLRLCEYKAGSAKDCQRSGCRRESRGLA